MFGHPVARKVPTEQMLAYVERLVATYLAVRQEDESFSHYAGRFSDAALMEVAAGTTPHLS